MYLHLPRHRSINLITLDIIRRRRELIRQGKAASYQIQADPRMIELQSERDEVIAFQAENIVELNTRR